MHHTELGTSICTYIVVCNAIAMVHRCTAPPDCTSMHPCWGTSMHVQYANARASFRTHQTISIEIGRQLGWALGSLKGRKTFEFIASAPTNKQPLHCKRRSDGRRSNQIQIRGGHHVMVAALGWHSEEGGWVALIFSAER